MFQVSIYLNSYRHNMHICRSKNIANVKQDSTLFTLHKFRPEVFFVFFMAVAKV